MKTGELIKQLKEHGWKLVRHGHRHDLYAKPGCKDSIAVQRTKGEVPKGTANKILKDAGIR